MIDFSNICLYNVVEVITDMTKRVYVIASFNPDGRVLPLWMRLSLDKDSPTYKIIDSKCISMPDKYAAYADFRCLVIAGQYNHEVTLRFYNQECKWHLTVNNSSPLAME